MTKASSPDDLIDQLYQLPLKEFTAARNALAKSGADASIKKLEKPTLAAWAVNQLYWRERKVYDEVIKTSTQVRTAYRRMLPLSEKLRTAAALIFLSVKKQIIKPCVSIFGLGKCLMSRTLQRL